MALLVDVDDMPTFLRGEYTDDDVTAALEWASDAVESYCERRFAFVADDVVTVRPYPDRSALLPNPPITDVTLVEGWMANPTSGASVMAWVTLTNWQWTDQGFIYDTTGLPGVDYQSPSWPAAPKSLRVTYSHGFDPIPDAVQSAVFKAAGIWLDNPSGLASKRVDDVQYTWANSSGGRDSADAMFGVGVLAPFRLVSIA
jgi:hypothetical protein